MPMPMPANPAAMAGGGGPPQGMPPQGGPPQPGGQTMPAPGNTASTDVNAIMEALKQVLQQAIDPRGYVDVNRLVTLWPQFSKVPFQVVMQLVQQNPDLLDELISQYGLNGLMVNGKVISADQLASMGGATGGAGPAGGY